MKPSRRNPTEGAFETALRLLARREHIRAQVRRKLAARGYSAPEIEDALTRLVGLSYVDDSRFARLLVRERLLRRGRGFADARASLRTAGVDEETAREALDEARAEADGMTLCREAARRKARTLREADPRRRREKLGRFLASRGFEAEMIAAVLDGLDEPEPEEDNEP